MENENQDKGVYTMKILFYGARDYDQRFFDKLKPEHPDIDITFIEANLYAETASLAAGYDGICAFVNADLGTEVIEELAHQGIRLILMRCAGYNNVDLKTAAECNIKVLRVPGYSPEAVAELAMALVLTANRHTHKAYIKCRENNFSLNGLMGVKNSRDRRNRQDRACHGAYLPRLRHETARLRPVSGQNADRS